MWILRRLFCLLTLGHSHYSDDRPYGGTCWKCGDKKLFIHDGWI